jgi:hypothetical protein
MPWPIVTLGNKAILTVLIVVICILIIDTSIIKIYYLGSSLSSYYLSLVVFCGISGISIFSQILLLEFVKRKSIEILASRRLHLRAFQVVIALIQYTLGSILIIVIGQMLTSAFYNVFLLIVATCISYGLSSGLMVILAYKLLSWYNSNRNHIVFSYALACIFIGSNAVMTLLYVPFFLFNHPSISIPHPGFSSPFVIGSVLSGILKTGYMITAVASFTSSWIATALLLRHYSRKLGTLKYWFIICLPLVYFLMQFQPLILNLFLLLGQTEPIIFSILYTLIFSLSNPTGGILFGVAFWFIARKLPKESPPREYLIISAIGFVILFSSNQGITLISAPYPPFGLPSVSFVGIASYLILAGIYSSAVSVGVDTKLRQSIRNLAINESKLVESLGTAQMQQEIQNRVLNVIKEQRDELEDQNAIQTSLSYDDVKEYLSEVIDEINLHKDQQKEEPKR